MRAHRSAGDRASSRDASGGKDRAGHLRTIEEKLRMNEKQGCTAQVRANVTPKEAVKVQELALADGRTVSAFVRRLLVDAIATK
jgi:hypothetical protein